MRVIGQPRYAVPGYESESSAVRLLVRLQKLYFISMSLLLIIKIKNSLCYLCYIFILYFIVY